MLMSPKHYLGFVFSCFDCLWVIHCQDLAEADPTHRRGSVYCSLCSLCSAVWRHRQALWDSVWTGARWNFSDETFFHQRQTLIDQNILWICVELADLFQLKKNPQKVQKCFYFLIWNNFLFRILFKNCYKLKKIENKTFYLGSNWTF